GRPQRKPRLPAALPYSRRPSTPRCCCGRFHPATAHLPAETAASRTLDAQRPSSAIVRWPLSCVVIGVLQAHHRSFESLGIRLSTVLACGQCANPIEEKSLVRRIDLNCRRNNAWVIKGSHCDLRPAVSFKS